MEKKPNRLINEKSLYLRQHAYNPIDWHPWCEEAFQKARLEDKPIFLSIGYSSCHWCHVMEKESFNDPEIAKILNENFVSIKVDREERPDIDKIYMTACQVLTGYGGYPLNLFLLPDKRPFFASTYIPKKTSGMNIGFKDLLIGVAETYKKSREVLIELSEKLTEVITHTPTQVEEFNILNYNTIVESIQKIGQYFDPEYGGFGTFPKFPSVPVLIFLINYYKVEKVPFALNMVLKTIDSMIKGGIYDHIGSGFFRYTVDQKWHIPHFEKMLYDQAMGILLLSEAYSITKNPYYFVLINDLVNFVREEFFREEGGFYTSIDADSEGEEGKFYLFTRSELKKILNPLEFDELEDIIVIPQGEEAFNLVLQDEVNFENYTKTKPLLSKIKKYRDKRIKPETDKKILTDWNCLMVYSLFRCYEITRIPLAYEMAVKTLSHFLKQWEEMKILYHSVDSQILGFLDDYAYLALDLLEAYNLTLDFRYLKSSYDVFQRIIDDFYSEEPIKGFYYTSKEFPHVLKREINYFDLTHPSGFSVALYLLISFSRILGFVEFELMAENVLKAIPNPIQKSPLGFGSLMTNLILYLKGTRDFIIFGDKSYKERLKEVLPHKRDLFLNYIFITPEDLPLLSKFPLPEIYKPVFEKPLSYYKCINKTPYPPAFGLENLEKDLEKNFT